MMTSFPIATPIPALSSDQTLGDEEPASSMEEQRENDLIVQNAIDEIMDMHMIERPDNTTKNYEPKQKEWKVSTMKIDIDLVVIKGRLRRLTTYLSTGLVCEDELFAGWQISAIRLGGRRKTSSLHEN